MTFIRRSISARLDAALAAVVDENSPLYYAGGAAPALDLPAHVRAASALRRFGDELAIVQDDVNAIAFRDVRGATRALPLPPGAGGRRVFDDVAGNKASKLDLEACAALPDGRLVAFGSGASPARETLVVVAAETEPRLRPAQDLYEALRNERAFSGSELNVEGALVRGNELLLFQRATGAPRAGNEAVNAIAAFDLDELLRWLDRGGPTPRLNAVTPFALGAVGGKNVGFTDAGACADGRIAVLACAEDSPDAVSDGAVLGCRFGFLDGAELAMTDVVDERGAPLLLKLEGIEARPDDATVFDVVADMDRPEEPARIARLKVRG